MKEINHQEEVRKYLNNSMDSKEIMLFLQHVLDCEVCSALLEQSVIHEEKPVDLNPKNPNKLLKVIKWTILATLVIVAVRLLWWFVLYYTNAV